MKLHEIAQFRVNLSKSEFDEETIKTITQYCSIEERREGAVTGAPEKTLFLYCNIISILRNKRTGFSAISRCRI